MPSYRRLRFRVAPADEELVTAWLWSVNVLGVSVDEPVDGAADGAATLNATFERDAVPEMHLAPDWLPALELVETFDVEERDWLALWRAAASPIPLGTRLLVNPRELDEVAEAGGLERSGANDGRFVLRIPARTAFGVGSHESTRLAYELLEAIDLVERSVLDVGCGSGILAMAALRLGARHAVGFDFDPAAALLAGQYARHNDVAPALYAGTVAALAVPVGPTGRFDVVVLNVLPHEIAAELEDVIAQLRDEGDLLVSGVLATEEASVRTAIERYACRHEETIASGEWVGLRFSKRAVPGSRAAR